MLFLWKPHTGTAEFKTGTHAWLARQSGAVAIAPRFLEEKTNIISTGDLIVNLYAAGNVCNLHIDWEQNLKKGLDKSLGGGGGGGRNVRGCHPF